MPSGAKARAQANIAALRTLRHLEESDAAPDAADLAVLAGWSSWGAIPAALDDRDPAFAGEREALSGLLSEREWVAARRTTLNAHYTDPAYVEVIWDTLTELGFTGGDVLEPGCGSGTFIGLAPPAAAMVGVELDPVTAAITARLYPGAAVRAESFADTRLPEGSFDAVVGNVPFAKVVLHDPVHNGAGHSLHNHFIIKSLALTKPGGIVAVLTSRYTMDAINPAARREIAALGDLLGAVRLPSDAHQRTAGTAAVTDLLLLRRRAEPPEGEPGWVRTVTVAVEVETPEVETAGVGEAVINSYFAEHPEHVLGTLRLGHGQYGADTLTVAAPAAARAHRREAGDAVVGGSEGAVDSAAVAAALRSATSGIAAAAREDGRGWAPVTGPSVDVRVAAVGDAARFEGFLSETEPGMFVAQRRGLLEPLEVPGTQARELRALLGLRDAVVELLEGEAASREDTTELDGLRATLNTRYDAYAREWGPLGRFTIRRTGRIDPATGEERLARLRPPVFRRFAQDPFAATVLALEDFDATTQSATKAAIMRQRVVAPRARRLGADTAEDALAICLDTYAEPRLGEIADLLGVDQTEARARLGTLVFDEPGTGRLVPAAEYLSGNVRVKLAEARAAHDATGQDSAGEDSAGEDRDADHGHRYAANVTALAQVIPADLGPEEIDARLGAAWIGPEDVAAFLRQMLGDPYLSVERTVGADWTVRSSALGVAATETWGTERYPAARLAQTLLRQSPIRVMDEIEGGAKVLNPVETTAAVEKARELSDRFAEWVWEDPTRAKRLAAVYNEAFNSIRLRSYDQTPAMSLPGLALTFAPRPHQLAAVARMVAEPAVGLFHEVGAGKTAEMVIGVMELRRLGLVAKPAIVVPNHMLEQFAREAVALYPQARVLAASADDLAKDKRQAFVARATTGDWDMVILTRTAFAALPLSEAEQQAYRDDELTPLREALAARGGEDRQSVKRIERKLLEREEAMKAKAAGVSRDGGVTFEMTGIDYLCIDELHDYKNLATASNISDANITGSQRATDLHMKIGYLRRTQGERVITGATATPIANSVTEAYVMARYLRPDLLIDAGIPDFDTWAATFGQTVTEIEMSPDGGSWRPKTRFAKFRNVPELLTMWHVSADVKTAEDLKLPVPDLTIRPDGARAPVTVVIDPTDELRSYMTSLAERAERIRSRAVDPTEDNMLKLTSDGRKAALDMRLVDPTAGGGAHPGGATKIEVAAARIAAIHTETADREFTSAATGQVHPRRGALQLVFCDLGTPGERWNVYDELRTSLVDRGVPAEGIRFIHDADTDARKAALFADCRSGQVAVLIGSTAKMGVGTNVQARAVALHHLDCPWRPADLAQRDGRILRQGNQNPEVSIYRYVVEGSFDAYSWQTVERKAKFIAQIMRGRLDVREIDDIGDTALSYNEVKALASGNPLLLEKAEIDAEVARLGRLERAHRRSQALLEHTVTDGSQTRKTLTERIAEADSALARRVNTRGDAFALVLHGRRYTERPEASDALRHAILAELPAAGRAPRGGEPAPIGELGGQPLRLRAEIRNGAPQARIQVGPPGHGVTVSAADADGSGPGLVIRLERAVEALDRHREQLAGQLADLDGEIAAAGARLGTKFPHIEALDTARARQRDITAEMEAQAARAAQPADQGGPDRRAEEAAQGHRGDARPVDGEQSADVADQTPAGSAQRERWAANAAARAGAMRQAEQIEERPADAAEHADAEQAAIEAEAAARRARDSREAHDQDQDADRGRGISL